MLETALALGVTVYEFSLVFRVKGSELDGLLDLHSISILIILKCLPFLNRLGLNLVVPATFHLRIALILYSSFDIFSK